jgi:propanol-preferring alcohol dehydrogenase
LLLLISSSKHSGVCHNDLSVMTNGWKTLPFPTPAGQVGGHEGIEIVQKLGQGADIGSVKLGDRVGIKWTAAACGSCTRCRGGFDGHCSTVKISG